MHTLLGSHQINIQEKSASQGERSRGTGRPTVGYELTARCKTLGRADIMLYHTVMDCCQV